MTNPVPSDPQWLVLYQIDDGDVWFDGGRWRAATELGSRNVTGAVQRLYGLGLVEFRPGNKLIVNKDGVDVLKRRSVYDVLERLNRRERARG